VHINRFDPAPSNRDLAACRGDARSLREQARGITANPSSRCRGSDTPNELAAIRHLHLAWVRGAYHRDV
jgi:hypothetical protein